jgi:tetratricopeptide (TPR) repeat protein
MTDEFLGGGHRQIVLDLDARLTAIRTGAQGVPSVVLLTGPSGAGKSRIIRELYRWYTAHQEQPGYWPPLPESGNADGAAASPGATSVLANRKVLGPPIDGFRWPAHALPSFTWWAFNCDRMEHGDAVDVIAQAAPTVHAHQLPALLAWRRTATVQQRLGTLKDDAIDRIREAFAAGSDEILGQVVEAAGLAIPGWGLLVEWGQGAGRAFRRHRTEQRLLATETPLGDDARGERASAAQSTAELILSAVNEQLPAIVVVEDIHLMGPDLVSFLQALQAQRPGKPVMVVATAWPEGHDRPEYAQWRTATAEAGNLAVVPVPELPAADLATFVRSAAPATPAADVSRLVRHYPNPYVLQLFLQLDSTRRRIARGGGALLVDDAALAGLPRGTVRDLYRRMWTELPPAVQQALSTAAGTLPAHTAGTWPFAHDIVAAAAVRAGFIAESRAVELAGALRQATDPYRWSLVDGPGVDRFREAVLDDIAAEQLDPDDVEELRAATIAELRDRLDRARGDGYLPDADERTLLVARWLLRLLSAEEVVTPVDATAAMVSAVAFGRAHRFGDAVAVLADGRWLEPVDPLHIDVLAVRGRFASWLGYSGRVAEAIAAFGELVTERTRVFGPDDFGTLVVRNNLADWLGYSGRVAEAVEQFQQLLADLQRVLGPDHAATLTCRNNLAHWIAGSGRPDLAVEKFRELLADRTRVLGADDPRTLTSRSNLASALGESGRALDALAQFRDLLADQVRVLGPAHPDTLTSRGNVASWLGQVGQVDAAVVAFEELIADRLSLFGPEDPPTLVARNNLAYWLGESGRTDEAVEQFRAVLTDQLRVLGPDHPSTFATRNNYALRLGLAGQVDEAIDQTEQLLADQLRVRGADHPDTLNNRHNLATWLAMTGRVDDAIEQLDSVLAGRVRVLGGTHPAVAETRNNLAFYLAQVGRLDEAVTQHRALLAGRLAAAGPDDPATLTARHDLASFLGRAGRVQDALDDLQSLLPDRVRVLGPDAPGTLTTRNSIAFWLGESGQPAPAAEQFGALVTDRVRVLGPDHPDTLTSRLNHGYWLARSGEPELAIEVLTSLLTDQARVLGEHHPGTDLTRGHLEALLGSDPAQDQ